MALSPGSKTLLTRYLSQGNNGTKDVPFYNSTYLENISDEELLRLAETLGSSEFQRRERELDRQDALEDFSSQLASLTASKMRQAAQTGRVQEAVTRTQGLANMMSNF